MRNSILLLTLLAMTLIPMNPSIAQGSSAQHSMTIDDLFRFDRVAEPALSPDGNWVAYQLTKNNIEKHESQTAIYLSAADNKSPPRSLTNSGKKDSRPRFSPDGKSIVFQSNRSDSMQLWLIDVQGGEARQLTSLATEASNAVWSPDGKKIAFLSTVLPEFSELPFEASDAANKNAIEEQSKRPATARIFTRLFYRHWDAYVEGKRQHIFVLNLKQGPNGLAPEGLPIDATPGDRDAYPTSSTFSSNEDFCFSPDSLHLIFTAVPVENESWSTNFDLCRVAIDNRSTKWPTLTKANLAADSGPRVSPDGGSLAWRFQSKPGCEADRWHIAVAKLTADGQIESPPVNWTAGVDESAGEFVWLNNEQIIMTADQRGAQQLLSIKAPAASTGNASSKSNVSLFSTDGGLHSGLNASQNVVVFSRSTMNQPAEIFVQRGRTPAINISQANHRLLSELKLPRPESIDQITIEGDRKMQMWLLKPPNFDPSKKYPTVYLVHGGPQGAWEDGWSYRWCPQLWAAQGYVVAMPNPRGSTGFGQQFVDEISGDWGGKCYRDLMTGADYVESLPYVDKDRIAAAGASFGGYMMNWFAVNTGRFCCLITHCSVWNFESMWGTTDELWFDEFEHGGLPWEQPEKYREFSPHVKAAALGKFKTPMLVIHNDLDFRCPIGQGLELFASLQRQGVPSRLVNFPDEGHWVNKMPNSRLWHVEVFGWLTKYCPTNRD
ncbi:MAG: S9 family peptidase [Pirellulaceae bacterium]|nr:S9 family peptidase [Pirellulaceae bacterium]